MVLSVDPTCFTRFYGVLKLGRQGVISLHVVDGVGRARRVGDKDEFGRLLGESPMLDAVRKG